MCRVLGVSKSGYYAWRERPPSQRAQQDAAILEKIACIHERSRGTYGAPRIHFELGEDFGIRCGKKRVARLMRRAGFCGVHRRTKVRTTWRGDAHDKAVDLVKRAFDAVEVDRLWMADITYVPTWAGFLYLAVVLDACSRKVVGWAMADHLRTELVLEALNMAIWNRRPNVGVIHHSDQGCQYTSLAFGRRCREAGIEPSMGSVGDAYDNAMCESFFATLECELIDRTTFRTRTEARLAVFDYIKASTTPAGATPPSATPAPPPTKPASRPGPRPPPSHAQHRQAKMLTT